MYYMRRDVHKFEITGTFIAIVGATLMMLDPYARRVGSKTTALDVDLLLVMSNFAAALYFGLNKSLM